MSANEIVVKANEIIKQHNVENFSAHSVTSINWKPHPPTVGAKTMEWANNKLGIIEGDAPCSARGCKLKLNEHKCDTVLFLKLSDKVDKTKAENAIKAMKELLEEYCLDGVAFLQENKECVFV
ncbi:MAG TPA: hypothetical protein PKK61_05570 [Defluviitaleaceae bacterium]|nr:hypothetical protein [Defluviitaleaceae bacterium]